MFERYVVKYLQMKKEMLLGSARRGPGRRQDGPQAAGGCSGAMGVWGS